MTFRNDDDCFRPELPVVLSIAGSDCSGGAGIQADIKTCEEFGVYCMTVVTAVTAQSPHGVAGIGYVGYEMLRKQLDCASESVMPDAIKIGMLPCAEAVEIIANFLDKNLCKNIIIDPVVHATSGGNLTGDSRETVDMAIRRLFPMSTLITPNIPELFYLTGVPESNDYALAAHILMSRSRANAILVKGGHSGMSECKDILFENGGKICDFIAQRIQSEHTHGTGCTLSSAIACGLAKGYTLYEAISQAKKFITEAIKWGERYRVFPHYGPLCHFYAKI